jgi:hypothetical protein
MLGMGNSVTRRLHPGGTGIDAAPDSPGRAKCPDGLGDVSRSHQGPSSTANTGQLLTNTLASVYPRSFFHHRTTRHTRARKHHYDHRSWSLCSISFGLTYSTEEPFHQPVKVTRPATCKATPSSLPITASAAPTFKPPTTATPLARS